MQKGFTLLELLITAGILSLVSVVITQIFVNTMRSNTKTETLKDVKQNGDFAMEAMTRLFQNAVSVTMTCTEKGEPTEITQTAELTDVWGSKTTLQCIVDSDAARIASVSGSISGARFSFLTSKNVSLVNKTTGVLECSADSFSFICTADGGKPASISIQFKLRQRNTAPSVYDQGEGTFQSNVFLRN